MRLLLFSGGIDSTAIAWIERPDRLLFIDYGQLPAKGEFRAAAAIAEAIGIPLDARAAPLAAFGAGALVGRPSRSEHAPEFWPFRNQMLVTLAVMAYADHEPLDVLIGSVAGDEVHPDGRPAFVREMNSVLSAQGRFRLVAPAVTEQAEPLLARAALPQSVLGWTFSCHTGEWACGQCRGCGKHNALKHALHAGS